MAEPAARDLTGGGLEKQCAVAAKAKRKAPHTADTNTDGNAKRPQLITAFTFGSGGQQRPALQSILRPQGGEQHHHQNQALHSQLATQHHSPESLMMQPFQQPHAAQQTQAGATHLQEGPGFNQHLPTSTSSAQGMPIRPQALHSQLATQHHSPESLMMQPFQQPHAAQQTQAGATHLQEGPGFNQHLPQQQEQREQQELQATIQQMQLSLALLQQQELQQPATTQAAPPGPQMLHNNGEPAQQPEGMNYIELIQR